MRHANCAKFCQKYDENTKGNEFSRTNLLRSVQIPPRRFLRLCSVPLLGALLYPLRPSVARAQILPLAECSVSLYLYSTELDSVCSPLVKKDAGDKFQLVRRLPGAGCASLWRRQRPFKGSPLVNPKKTRTQSHRAKFLTLEVLEIVH